MIALRQLRLVGTSRNYDVKFVDDAGSPRSLAVIAGEILTGKTSVFEFIDYCLGQDRHPNYPEIQRQARVAQLELELFGEVHVIERPLFGTSWVWLHRCSLAAIEEPHETTKLQVDPAGDRSSLNWLLLTHSALEGVVLKEAPTKDVSGTDPLSFRDVMWLAFLTSERMGKRHLLFESGNPMKHLKLRQLIEVIFGVHDQELAGLGARISLLEKERAAHLAEIEAIQTFLAEHNVRGHLEIEADRIELKQELEPLQETLARVSGQMRAETDFADLARRRYAETRRTANLSAARIRDRESLLRRLLPLQAQYAEDERKLVFYSEAKHLFDPLQVQVCPACLSELEESPEIVESNCTLCGTMLEPSSEPVDVEAERAAIRARLRGVSKYIGEVQQQLASDQAEYVELSSQESRAQAELDQDLAAKLAPFVVQRDELADRISALEARERDLGRQQSWLLSVERRSREVEQLTSRIENLRDDRTQLEENRPSRDAVVNDLTLKFESILRAFGFPKLDNPAGTWIATDFVPHVRSARYDDLGSDGAVTLISIAWQLAIFELAVERGRPHPGFLMIDSPQANVKPATGEDEYSTPEIADRLWAHLAEWSAGSGRNAQLLVVDHVPPPAVEENVVARFSGLVDQPPYGLIDNETSDV